MVERGTEGGIRLDIDTSGMLRRPATRRYARLCSAIEPVKLDALRLCALISDLVVANLMPSPVYWEKKLVPGFFYSDVRVACRVQRSPHTPPALARPPVTAVILSAGS